MISVEQAEEAIAAALRVLPTESVAVTSAHGRILRETLCAERDQPPFDRAMMDGVALRAGARLPAYRVVGETAAGSPPGAIGAADECIEIMTGAPMPAGGDCVVPVERLSRDGNRVELHADQALTAGQFVHPRASDHTAGTTLLRPGARLNAAEIAVAVSAGKATLVVSRQPRVAVCATGDELVDVGAPVLPHQIRRSNDYALAAMADGWGFGPCVRHHVGDDVHAQIDTIGAALDAADVLVLTGGVSMGRHDHVSEVLHALGVELVFHRVSQRPGKPMWFGVAAAGQPVFALPGNPVSALVNMRRYVLPALEAMSAAAVATRVGHAVLDAALTMRAALTCFMPACARSAADGRLRARLRPTNTSGDFTALAGTDGFVELARDESDFAAGTVVPWFSW